MQAIYKFLLNGGNVTCKECDTVIKVPKGQAGVRILKADLDPQGKMCVWALCNGGCAEPIDIKIRVRGKAMNYKNHLIANMKVAIRCFVLMVLHALHGIIPCKYTSHDYWGRGTGHNCNDVMDWVYIGLIKQGPYIFHVFGEPIIAVQYN